MNAIARAALAESTFTRGVNLSFSVSELKILSLVLLCLISALGIIYTNDLNRRLMIQHNKGQSAMEILQIENSRLLLEQSFWGAQARLQMVAQERLHMQIPKSAEVKLVKL